MYFLFIYTFNPDPDLDPDSLGLKSLTRIRWNACGSWTRVHSVYTVHVNPRLYRNPHLYTRFGWKSEVIGILDWILEGNQDFSASMKCFCIRLLESHVVLFVQHSFGGFSAKIFLPAAQPGNLQSIIFTGRHSGGLPKIHSYSRISAR